MGNYDQMAAAVSELSGGKNVVLLDDIGMPSIYVRIPKGKNSELVSGLICGVLTEAIYVLSVSAMVYVQRHCQC